MNNTNTKPKRARFESFAPMKLRWRKIGNRAYEMDDFAIMWGPYIDYPWTLIPPSQYIDESSFFKHQHFETLSEAKRAVKNMRKRLIQKNPRD